MDYRLEHRRHVLASALRRFDTLISKRWLTSKFDPANASPEDLADAAVELPLIEVEQEGVQAMLRQLALDASELAPIPGVASLYAAMATLDRRLASMKAAIDGLEHASQRLRADTDVTSEVLSSTPLLGSILSFTGPGDFLFLATVSRRVGAVGIAHVASVYGADSLLMTELNAALMSTSRLALAQGDKFADMVHLCSQQPMPRACELLGEMGCAQAIVALRDRGLYTGGGDVLVGAARKCNVGLVQSLWAGPLNKPELPEPICRAIGLQAAKRGDDGTVLSWLAPQLRAGTAWPAYYHHVLCNAAAMYGRLNTLEFLFGHGLTLFGEQRPLSLDDNVNAGADDDNNIVIAPPSAIYVDASATKHVVTLVDAAAMSDDAAALRWLQSRQPLEFTGVTMQLAAQWGGLPTLKWLHAQECPHDINAVASILLKSHFVVAMPPKMAWVRSCGGGDWSAQGMTDMLVEALAHSTPALAHWLRAEGARWPADLAEVVRTKVEVVRPRNLLWAVQQGCPFGRWSSEVCEVLSEHSAQAAAVKLALHDLGCPCTCPRL
eukprot:TRINITY_DN80_c0_g1_i1.p1 TRINITY_DN80_c0_g1~~TRINITY_DN80_c0_g1_i1.p1  ORF type:complete len:551 (-),score=122.88 TRINITY_DN80_c0_g1_i1:142-1794(-)